MKRTPFIRKEPPPLKKVALARKTPLRKRSPKRAKYMASPEREAGAAHMLAVKALPCICCGHPPPSYAHHVTGDRMPRNDFRVLPLCYACHQGPQGYHADKANWVAKHGPDYGLLPRIAEMLAPN